MSAGIAWLTASAATTAAMRAPIANAFRCPPDDLYALAPFAPLHDGEQWWWAAMTCPPPMLDPRAAVDWQPDGDVILIDPTNGAMQTFDRDPGCFVVPDGLTDDTVTLYTNGIVLARDWCAARAAHGAALRAKAVPGAVAEPHGMPGIALCGSLAWIRSFAPLRIAQTVRVDNPRLTGPIAKAMLRSANLPNIEAAPARLRAVA